MEQAPSTLTELFERLLPTAMIAGIGVLEYWDLTLAEITLVVKDYSEKKKEQAKLDLTLCYQQARMTANFVSLVLNGKEIPSLTDCFPSFGTQETKETNALSSADYNRAMMAKEMFIDFANRRNSILAQRKED